MGYALMTGRCISCGELFSFNPMRVPSTSVITGKREPVCRGCMDELNAVRVEQGLEPFAIAEDAYEACDERELGE